MVRTTHRSRRSATCHSDRSRGISNLFSFQKRDVSASLDMTKDPVRSLDITKTTEQANPLREGLSTRAVPQPCAIVIFGVTGDLAHRKLIPALYNLAADGELPPAGGVVGVARRGKTDDGVRKESEEAVRKISRPKVCDEIWKKFCPTIWFPPTR